MTEPHDAESWFSRYAPLISRALERALPEATGPQGRLHEAMRYSVLAGGKTHSLRVVPGRMRSGRWECGERGGAGRGHRAGAYLLFDSR